jgi:hypothetical protein
MLEMKLPASLVSLFKYRAAISQWQETESVEFTRLNEISEATGVRLWEELIPKANKTD